MFYRHKIGDGTFSFFFTFRNITTSTFNFLFNSIKISVVIGITCETHRVLNYGIHITRSLSLHILKFRFQSYCLFNWMRVPWTFVPFNFIYTTTHTKKSMVRIMSGKKRLDPQSTEDGRRYLDIDRLRNQRFIPL